MINLREYVIGMKYNNSDGFAVTHPERIKKQTEDCVVLLIPKSEFEEIINDSRREG